MTQSIRINPVDLITSADVVPVDPPTTMYAISTNVPVDNTSTGVPNDPTTADGVPATAYGVPAISASATITDTLVTDSAIVVNEDRDNQVFDKIFRVQATLKYEELLFQIPEDHHLKSTRDSICISNKYKKPRSL